MHMQMEGQSGGRGVALILPESWLMCKQGINLILCIYYAFAGHKFIFFVVFFLF